MKGNAPYIVGIGAALGLVFLLLQISSPAQDGSSEAYRIPQDTLDSSLGGAVWLGDADEAMWALENGANPNAKMQDGTPVLSGAIQELPGVAKELVRRGADPNTVGEWGWPVVCSAAGVSLELTKMLVERGANLQVTTKDGHSPLTVAAMADRPEIVAYLLKKGLPLEGRHDIEGYPDGLSGVTPLMVAARYAAPGSLNALLEAGADATAFSSRSVNALGFALAGFERDDANAHKILSIMTRLLERGALVDQAVSPWIFRSGSQWNPLTDYGTAWNADVRVTLLTVATAFRWPAAVDFLLSRGADPNLRSQGGIPLLFWAALPYGEPVMERLLKAGADPETEGNLPGYLREMGVTALMVAAAVGTPETVAALLRAGVNPNRCTAGGVPALAFCWLGNMRKESDQRAAIAQLLLDAGADPDGRPDPHHPDRPWKPPLRAVREGDWCAAVTWLLDHGADPMKSGSDGVSAAAEIKRQLGEVPAEVKVDWNEFPDCFRKLRDASQRLPAESRTGP